uniref:Uncharacterized protein LOC105632341 isoform X1 n=1 Tax=Rhizophora mucronata TaxID=61149 RepID=A0A2P2JKZ5_RHIMU
MQPKNRNEQVKSATKPPKHNQRKKTNKYLRARPAGDAFRAAIYNSGFDVLRNPKGPSRRRGLFFQTPISYSSYDLAPSVKTHLHRHVHTTQNHQNTDQIEQKGIVFTKELKF